MLTNAQTGFDKASYDYDKWENADPRKMRAELSRATKAFNEGTREATYDDDPKRMLAEIERAAPQAYETATSQHNYGGDDDGLKVMLADLNANAQRSGTVRSGHDDKEFGFEEMLEEFKGTMSESPLAVETVPIDDPKAMLADLNATAQARGLRFVPDADEGLSDDDTNDDLDTLRRKIATKLPSFRQWASQGIPGYDKHTPIIEVQETGALEKEIVPYAVALRLESAGSKWEDVQGWSKYLFSDGPDGHEAQEQKEEMIKRENEKLDIIIKHVLEEELRHREVEDKQRLPCRLIVSNLAADTDEEAVRTFFGGFKWDM